jgi:hypothetical protein
MGARKLWVWVLAMVMLAAACEDDEDGIGGFGGAPHAGNGGSGVEAGDSGVTGGSEAGGTTAGGAAGESQATGGSAGKPTGSGGKRNGGSAGALAGDSASSGEGGGAGAQGGQGGDGGEAGDGGSVGGAGTSGASGSSGAGMGGAAGAGAGGNAGAGTGGTVSSQCKLTADDLTGVGTWASSSSLPCGRLGRLDDATGPLLDVGHSFGIVALARTTDRLVSTDEWGGWVLWNLADRTILARGVTPPKPHESAPTPHRPALTANVLVTLATSASAGFELQVRSAVDGELRSTIPISGVTGSSPYGVARDGSYVWAASNAELLAFDPDGVKLVGRSGNYSQAKVFAAVGELRVGNGPAGLTVIERVSTSTGGSTISAAHQGAFHSWFLDGERFFTTVSNTVRVYAAEVATAEVLVALPLVDNLAGKGGYFWTFGDYSPGHPLDVYSVTSTGALVQSYAFGAVSSHVAIPGGSMIAVLGRDTLELIDLGASGVSSRSVDVPVPYGSAFAADDAGGWAFGARDGEVFEGERLDRPLSCGKVASIAGAANGTTAIATAHRILLFKLAGETREYVGDIAFRSSHVELSMDGSVLAAAAGWDGAWFTNDNSLRVFSMPSREELKVWPYTWEMRETLLFRDFTMSAAGNRFVHISTEGLDDTQRVLDLEDNVHLTVTPSDDEPMHEPMRLSPNGTRVADSTAANIASWGATDIYEDGVLVDAVAGIALGWLDDDRVLIGRPTSVVVYDLIAHAEQETGLTPSHTQVVSPTLTYTNNRIESVPSGEAVWHCSWGGARAHAAAADYVVFVPVEAEERVVIDRY